MSKICFIANLFPSEKDPSFGSFVGKNYEQLKSQGNDIVSKVVIDYRASGMDKLRCYLRFIGRGIRAIAKRDYDYIYFHYLTYSTLCLLPFLLVNRPRYVVNIHGDDLVGDTPIHKVMGSTSKLVLKYSAAVIVPSSFFKATLLELHPWYDKDKIIVSPSGGVDFSLFKPEAVAPKPGFTLGYVSRVDEGKGWQELLEALAILKRSRPEILKGFKLNMFGTGAQVDALNTQIEALELTSLVTYFGALKPQELANKYCEMDAFIFPTHRESFGLVAVEALACGTPVLASNISPVNEVVLDGKNGLLFEVKNANAIAAGITNILTMKKQDFAMLCAHTRESVKHYNATQVAKQLEQELKKRLST